VSIRASTHLSIARAISLILGTAVALPAFSQENTELEEVVVTGIRGSLTSSMELKRDAQGVMDGIVAEDIGKFPDTNLAESMQRVSGVSIDRSLGEGSRVTVRGVGPDFNLVLLNGRQMPPIRVRLISPILRPNRFRRSKFTKPAAPRLRRAASVRRSISRPHAHSTTRACTAASAPKA
jgi:hypothetical protein